MTMFTRRSRKTHWMSAILIALLCVSALTACGDDESDEGGSSEPANNSEPVNNDEGNNAEENNGENNNDEVFREQVFPIGYVLRNRAGDVPDVEEGGDYMIVASDGSQSVKVNPEGVTCQDGCEISGDLQWFVWTESTSEGNVLKVAPIESLSYSGASVNTAETVELAQNVLSYQVGGGTIAYETSSFELFVGDLPGDNPASIGTAGSAEDTQGGFYLNNEGTQLITWEVTLESMTLTRHDLGTQDVLLNFYTFESTGFGGTGSFYTSSEQLAMSPDGKFLATISTGLVDTNRCGSSADCTGSGEICGENARCTAQRLTLNMINMEETPKLGQACASDAECGEAHFCDFADPTDPESGRCLPGRTVLGPSGPTSCSALQDGEFTEIRDDLVWAPDSSGLYLLGAENCDLLNVPRTAILKYTPALEQTIVYQNPGVDYSPGNCYDAEEEVLIVEDPGCILEVRQMALSPRGDTFAFTANAPTAASTNRYELFTIDSRASRNKKWFKSPSLEFNAEQVQGLSDF